MNIETQPYQDGKVIVDDKQLQKLIDQRNEYETDLRKVANNLMSFMKKLGCLDEDNKLKKPRLGKLTGAVMDAFSNPEAGIFKDLRDLEPEFDKYAKLVQDGTTTTNG